MTIQSPNKQISFDQLPVTALSDEQSSAISGGVIFIFGYAQTDESINSPPFMRWRDRNF